MRLIKFDYNCNKNDTHFSRWIWPISLLSKKSQLVESKGLWEQEFLIAFHFKVYSLFNKKWKNYISDFQQNKFILKS